MIRWFCSNARLIGQWHGLSDPKLERALKVRLDFLIFCRLDLHGSVPDETPHCRFRNALVKGEFTMHSWSSYVARLRRTG